MTKPRLVALALVVGIAAAVAVAGGPKALVVLAFFAGLVGVIALAAGLGGEWIRDVSARRFERRNGS